MLSINHAAKEYKIAKGTLSYKNRTKHNSRVGHSTVLTLDEESLIVKTLIKTAEWGYAISNDNIRYILIEWEKTTRFKINLPGKDWMVSLKDTNI